MKIWTNKKHIHFHHHFWADWQRQHNFTYLESYDSNWQRMDGQTSLGASYFKRPVHICKSWSVMIAKRCFLFAFRLVFCLVGDFFIKLWNFERTERWTLKNRMGCEMWASKNITKTECFTKTFKDIVFFWLLVSFSLEASCLYSLSGLMLSRCFDHHLG